MGSHLSPEQNFACAPVNAWIGHRLLRCAPGSASVELAPRREHLQETGIVQGGVLTALADSAAVYAVVPALPAGATVTGTQAHMLFLRPGLADAGPLAAESSALHLGRRTAVVAVEIRQQGKRIAHGDFSFLILPPTGEA